MQKRRFVTYTNLDPGEYVFRVIGSNNDGVWNEEGASLNNYYITSLVANLVGIYVICSICCCFIFNFNKILFESSSSKHQLELEHEHSEKLEEVDQMKSRFFANISHEFRTPLTLISGPSNSIITESSEEEIKKKAGTIKRNANRLLVLINQLLDLSKLEAGRLKLEASCGNIVAFVKGIAMSFESLAETKDIILKVKSTNNVIELYY